ncbi:MAG: hypothetical protein FJ100_21745 [Deltaproteobacteria bacterium]|nr:hypothetical protein [Deltaproteobacteria bacterium]
MATNCGANRTAEQGFAPQSTWVPPLKQSVYLRAIQDRDPSGNLGRFFAANIGQAQIDESNAFPSRCGKFFKPTIVEASGEFDESFTASTSVGASLSVPVYAVKAGAGYGSNGEVRVHYKLKKVMRAEVDTDGLDRCCAADAKQCGVKYISEFYLGDGEVYQYLGSEAQLKAGATYSGVGGDVEFKNGTAWKKVNRIDNAYFAFKTSLISAGGGDSNANVCSGDWQSTPPTSLDGQYFVGMSRPAASKQAARQDALLNGRRQTMQYIATQLKEARVQTSKDLDAVFSDDAAISAASEGLARLVKDRCWKDGEVAGPTTRFESSVLMFFPQAEIANAAKAVAGALKGAGLLSPADAAAVEAAGDKGVPPR